VTLSKRNKKKKETNRESEQSDDENVLNMKNKSICVTEKNIRKKGLHWELVSDSVLDDIGWY